SAPMNNLRSSSRAEVRWRWPRPGCAVLCSNSRSVGKDVERCGGRSGESACSEEYLGVHGSQCSGGEQREGPTHELARGGEEHTRKDRTSDVRMADLMQSTKRDLLVAQLLTEEEGIAEVAAFELQKATLRKEADGEPGGGCPEKCRGQE